MTRTLAITLAAALSGCHGTIGNGNGTGAVGNNLGGAAASAIVGLDGKCLDDSGDGTADGNKIQLWTCNGTDAQAWSYTNGQLVGPGGKCLDVQYDQQAAGTIVQLWTCNGTEAQKWRLQNGSIVSAGGFCLDVTGAASDDGTQLEIWSCTGGANQQWSMPSSSGGGGSGGGNGGGGNGGNGGGGGSPLPLSGPTGTWSYATYGGMGFYYLLPDGFDPSQRYPLVTYLHQWGGEVSLIGLGQIDSFFNQPPFKSNYRAVVVAPQCENSDIWTHSWGGITYPGISTCEGQALAIIDAVAQNAWVDGNYLTGYSLGAIGTWHLVLTHPGAFTRAMSVSGSIGCGTEGCDWNAVGYTPDGAASILNGQATELVAVHGDADQTVSISWDQDVAADAPAHYTFVPVAGGDHGIFGSIYTDPSYLRLLMGY